MIVCVFQLPDALATALRVARSVTASSSTMRVSMFSPWIPDRFVGDMVATARPTADGWRQSLTHSSADERRSFTIVAKTGPAPKWFVYKAQRPDGVTLYLPGESEGDRTMAPQEASRLLDELVYTAPDLSWVGGR